MERMKIEIADRQNELVLPPETIERTVRLALDEHNIGAELSIALVADEEMIELNRRFLNRNGTTDVMAFPYGKGPGWVCGEIVVNASRAVREAASRAHGAEDELLLYLVHGLLHLLGHDDHDPQRRRIMREWERRILAKCGRAVEF